MKPISEFLQQRAPGRASRPFVPVYACKTCNDTGYVRPNYPPGHPMFGRLLPCPDCNQRAQTEPDDYGLLPADRVLSWGEIIEGFDPSVTEAKSAIQQALAKGYGWVYLWGGYGTAKTTLLKIAVAEFLRSQAKIGVYLRMADLVDEIRSAFDDKFPNYAAMAKVRWFSTLPLLAIDELEKVNNTGFVEERRFQVLDSRYEAVTRQQYGVTLLAANVPPSALPGALASRIQDARFRVVQITAEDMRPEMNLLGG